MNFYTDYEYNYDNDDYDEYYNEAYLDGYYDAAEEEFDNAYLEGWNDAIEAILETSQATKEKQRALGFNGPKGRTANSFGSRLEPDLQWKVKKQRKDQHNTGSTRIVKERGWDKGHSVHKFDPETGKHTNAYITGSPDGGFRNMMTSSFRPVRDKKFKKGFGSTFYDHGNVKRNGKGVLMDRQGKEISR